MKLLLSLFVSTLVANSKTAQAYVTSAPGANEPCVEWDVSAYDVCINLNRTVAHMTDVLKDDRRPECNKRNAADEFVAFTGLDLEGGTLNTKIATLCDNARDKYALDDFERVELRTLVIMELGSPQGRSGAQSCIGNFELTVKNGCTFANLLTVMNNQMKKKKCKGSPVNELKNLLGWGVKRSTGDLIEYVENMCLEGWQRLGQTSFEDVTGHDKVFTQAYFDGGSYYNDDRETLGRFEVQEGKLKDYPGGRIKTVHDKIAKKHPMVWPRDQPNFERCAYRSAMCCWTQDRQAGDNNGNCATPYDQNCRDSDPGDNCDVCFHDMSRSPISARVDRGLSFFPGDDNTGEGAIHCHGLAWSNDRLHPSAAYKANNLFYVSMYDHLTQRGYVRNVAGAPMCGCLEQMPTVTRSDCTEIQRTTEVVKFTNEYGTLRAKQYSSTINFNACKGVKTNNDLNDYYKKLSQTGHALPKEYAAVRRQLVGKGKCDGATKIYYETIARPMVANGQGIKSRAAAPIFLAPGNRSNSLKAYQYHANKSCTQVYDFDMTGGYYSQRFLHQAIAKCDRVVSCGGVYDYKCDEDGYRLCGANAYGKFGNRIAGVKNQNGSCVYQKKY